MGDKTKIEWTDTTWNPIRGCSRKSAGCQGCYAEEIAARFSGPGMPFEGLAHRVDGKPRWTGIVKLFEEKLTEPLRWRRPRRIFVNSVSDLFHENLPDEVIDKVFAVMALAPQHTFQVLTKRADRMRRYIADFSWESAVENCRGAAGVSVIARHTFNDLERAFGLTEKRFSYDPVANAWPLPNVWLGVSVEDQAAADERVPDLLATPAAVRFLSCEPLIGPVDLSEWLWRFESCKGCPCPDPEASRDGFEDCCHEPDLLPTPIHWVIAGGESGTSARPAHLEWFRDLRDQCAKADLPFFFKQWGEYHPSHDHDDRIHGCNEPPLAVHVSGRIEYRPLEAFRLIGAANFFKWANGWAGMCRIGKKNAGRLLDGIEHSEFPKVTP